MSKAAPISSSIIMSPTPLVNSIPRPKSPRQGGPLVASSRGGFLAAERFHLAYHDGAVDPNVRRLQPRNLTGGRRLQQQQQQQQGIRESPSVESRGTIRRSDSSPTRMSTPSSSRMDSNPLSLRGGSSSSSSNYKGKSYPSGPYVVAVHPALSNVRTAKSKTEPLEAQHSSSMIQGCIKQTTARTRQIDSCTSQVRQVVRQECQSNTNNSKNSQGDDKMFFTIFAPDQNSIGQSQSTETSVHEPTKKTTTSKSNHASSRRYHEPQRRGFQHEQHQHHHHRPVQRVSTSTNYTNLRSPEPATIVQGMQQQENDSQEDVRRPRGSYEAREGSDSPLERESEEILFHAGDDFHMLRERRLLLFQSDGQDDMVPKAQFSRVLGELIAQDDTIQMLKKELSLMKKNLDETTQELTNTQDACQRNLKTLSDLRAKSLAERKSLEERLGKVTHENKALSTKMSSLQVESTRLRAQVRNYSKGDKQARAVTPPSAGKQRMDSQKNPQTPPVAAASEESTLILSLRAEMVELRSQLVEAKEVQIHLKSSNDNAQKLLLDKSEVARLQSEVTRLEKQLEKAEQEISELREQQRKERTDHAQLQAGQSSSEERTATSAAQSKEALLNARRALEGAQARENELSAQLDDVKKELVVAKRTGEIIRIEAHAKEQQIQRELKQLEADAKDKSQKSDDELRIREIEIKSLKAEVTRLSQKLESALQEHLAKEAEFTVQRNNTEDELAHSKGAVQVLQTKLSSLDDRLADVEAEAECLRGQNKGDTHGNSPTFSFSRLLDMTGMNGEEKRSSPLSVDADADDSENTERLSRWQHQLKRSRANESVLSSEVTILRELASNVRSQADFDRLKFMENESLLKREMEKLQSELAELACEKQLAATKIENLSRNEEELLRSKAREQSLLNEIFELKTKLELLETQVKEERFRASEEARMSCDTKANSAEQIEQLQNDLNESKKEKEGMEKSLRLKLADLESRLKFAQQSTRQLSRVVAEDGTEKRLRSDLKSLQEKLKVAQKQATEVQKKADDNAKKYEAAVTKLRNELALMRARRIAEQKLETRERDFESTNSTPMGSPDRSTLTPLRVSFSSDGSVGGKSHEFHTPPTGQRRKPNSPSKGIVRKRTEMLNSPGGEATTPSEVHNSQIPFGTTYNSGSPKAQSPPYTPVHSARSYTSSHVSVASPPSVPPVNSHSNQPFSIEVPFQPFPVPHTNLRTASTSRIPHPVQVMEPEPHDLASLGSGVSLRSSSPRKGVGAVPVGRDDTVSLVNCDETAGRLPASKTLDVAGFHRKLRESNKRRVNANSKLKGLVKASDEIIAEHLRIRGTCNDLFTRVETQSNVSREEDQEEHEDEIPERTYRVVQDGDTRRCLV